MRSVFHSFSVYVRRRKINIDSGTNSTKDVSDFEFYLS